MPLTGCARRLGGNNEQEPKVQTSTYLQRLLWLGTGSSLPATGGIALPANKLLLTDLLFHCHFLLRPDS